MKTILIPIDFTDATANAVHYAKAWCKDFMYENIILLKSIQHSIFEDVSPSIESVNLSQEYNETVNNEMRSRACLLSEEINNMTGTRVNVFYSLSEKPLLRAILEMVESEQPELIVIGADHYNAMSNGDISKNVISIAKFSPINVLIVPSGYSYQRVEQVLLPYDYNAVSSLGKLDAFHQLLSKWKNTKLLVLNIDNSDMNGRRNENHQNIEIMLHTFLRNYSHEIFYTHNKSIINGILEFSRQHVSQLLIALPGRHSFLYRLTHKSISEAILRNAHMPILILK